MPSIELYFCCSCYVFRHCSQYRKYSKHIFIINNYSTGARWVWVGYNHLISNKRRWNNCFIKNTHKISRIVPDFTCKNNWFSACLCSYIFGIMDYNHDGSANQSSRIALSGDSVFNSNRYPTISSVVYITTILRIVCICLMTSQSAVSDPLPSMHVNVPLSTPPYLTIYSLAA